MVLMQQSYGEVYYLQQMLYHFPARSFEELLWGQNTYHEACIAAGLFDDQGEADICFEQVCASPYASAPSVRALFVNLYLEFCPVGLVDVPHP